MIPMVVTLFARPVAGAPWEILRGKSFAAHWAFALVFAVAPAFRWVNLWDSYLSFALYSGNQNQAYIYLSDDTFERLPKELKGHVYEESKNLNFIPVQEWSYGELNVPPYPEPRIFFNVARRICSLTGSPPDVRLAMQMRFGLVDSNREVSRGCAELGN